MILYFENAEKFINGINELSGDLGFEIGTKEQADVSIAVAEYVEDHVEVILDGKEAKINYGGGLIRFYRGLGLLCEALSGQTEKFYKKETPQFLKNGFMLDMARNMVFRPEMIKVILRKMAIMGLNTFHIYLEDLFEVPEYPYFGHMRGRYTKEEIHHIDHYAKLFGIELVPVIECLSHMEHLLKWEAMAQYRDNISTLLVGDEKVYNLIDKMIAAIADSFSTKRLNISMDEAEGMGYGKYRQKNAIKPQFELFCEHLNRVVEIAKKYGFEIIADSDMFFKMATGVLHYTSEVTFEEDKLKLIPKDITLVYWRYGIFYPEGDEKTYDDEENEKVLKIHRKMTDKMLFLGGIQTWTGPIPLYRLTLSAAKTVLEACMRNNIKEVAVSAWNDCDGAPLIFALLGVLNYAEIDYNGFYDEETLKKRFKYICGVDADDILDLEDMNFPDGRHNEEVSVLSDYINMAHGLLFNDPLIGLMDKYIENSDAGVFYTNMYNTLKDRGTKTGLFAPAFDYVKAILYVLTQKADYGIRLKKAYTERDTSALHSLYKEAAEIKKRYEELKKIAREFYLYYHKGFGYEVTEMRFATMASRFETVCYHLDRLKEDPSYRVEELEEERLYLIPPNAETDFTLMEYRFERFFSANNITKGIEMG